MPKGTAKVVLTLAVFAAVAVILLNPIITTVNANTGTQSITNESVTADFNEKIELTGYDIDPNSETVWGYNETSGNYEQASADAYTLYEQQGAITFNNSSTTLIDSGETVKVSYDYQASSELTSLILGFIPVMVGVLIFVPIATRVQEMM